MQPHQRAECGRSVRTLFMRAERPRSPRYLDSCCFRPRMARWVVRMAGNRHEASGVLPYSFMDETTIEHRQPRTIRTYPGVAWGIIIFLVLLTMVIQRWPVEEAGSADDGGFEVQLQGKVLAAGAEMGGGGYGGMYTKEAEKLNSGSIGQRQRAIVLIADVAGPIVAAERLAELDELIAEHTGPEAEHPVEMSEEQRRVQEALHLLYGEEAQGSAGEVDRPRVEALDQAQRDLLVAELDWFGELALVPEKNQFAAARKDFFGGPIAVLLALSVLMIVLVVAGVGGVAGLVILVVFAFQGRLGRGLAPGRAPHGMYAETFAVWMALFYLLQFGGLLVGIFAQQHVLFIMFVAFFLSLLALGWPVVRGVPWRVVRQDIGLHPGRGMVVEGAVGVGGYAMTLPILAIAVVIVIVLVAINELIRQGMGGAEHPLEPSGSAAHPLFEALSEPGVWIRVQMLLAAAVAAPIVEEIMFRGVFYRHVRDAFRSPAMGALVPTLGSTAVTGLLFAAIHPVPWFAWPGLFALALGFALLREWRGSVVPGIVMHGLHNAMVVTMVMLILGV